MHISATEFKQNLGSYLIESIRQPVVIDKGGKPISVLVAHEDFKKMLERIEILEEQCWIAQAKYALDHPEERLSAEESMKYLLSDD